jgi:hypothetical protein
MGDLYWPVTGHVINYEMSSGKEKRYNGATCWSTEQTMPVMGLHLKPVMA